jgi:hypothetical protein
MTSCNAHRNVKYLLVEQATVPATQHKPLVSVRWKTTNSLTHNCWTPSTFKTKLYFELRQYDFHIVGSNPTWDMDVYVRLFYVYAVLCGGSGLAAGWAPTQGVLPTV